VDSGIVSSLDDCDVLVVVDRKLKMGSRGGISLLFLLYKTRISIL